MSPPARANSHSSEMAIVPPLLRNVLLVFFLLEQGKFTTKGSWKRKKNSKSTSKGHFAGFLTSLYL